MHVQMRDRLAGRFLAVDYDSISAINAQLSRELRRHQMQMTEQVPIVPGNLGMRCNNLPRDDQNVYGSLGIDVSKGQAPIVFVDDVGGYLTIDDLFE
jgi:hypothetical protein